MIEIPLTQGQVALIDDEDYELVSQYKWCASYKHGKWYAQRFILRNGKKTTEYMHILLMGTDGLGRTVDHVSGDGLDNRRHNMRWATHSEQARNRSTSRSPTSPFKGVYSSGRGWKALIMSDGASHYLGTFRSASEAALAYDAKARELHGDFARVNFE